MTLPFDPEMVAAAARAQTNPIPMGGYDDNPAPPDNVVPLSPPQPTEGIIPLGYDRGAYFYLSRSSRQIHSMTADQHTARAMMSMASVPHFWQRSQFVSEKGNIFWDQAADWLMTACRAVGIFDADRVRGRGAWVDNERTVLHLGDRLLVDGHQLPLMLPGSSAIYPGALPLSFRHADPLDTARAHELIKVCASLRWAKPISGRLFAGWIVCAMVCGALRWRPSIWVTGSTGSGKSWLLDNVLAPLVGPIALQVLSKTSEAGIRQTLNSDAMPVIFDEFEREDAAAAIRVQGVLDLMRQASSESEKKIIKGTQQQTSARAFRIRSCFAFSSINVGLAHAADESRVTVLALQPPDAIDVAAQASFMALGQRVAALITPDYADGMLTRSVGLLGAIRQNAETFAVAVAGHMGTRRLGDQLGALLAGAYSLHSNKIITDGEAVAYLKREDWGDDASGGDVVRDEYRLLSYLTAHRVRLSLGNGPTMEVTMGRLLSASFGADDRVPRDTAELELRDYGIRVQTKPPIGAWVSTNHPTLAKMLTGTPWGANWSRALARLPAAVSASATVIRFGLGHRSRAVWLPISLLDSGE